MASGDLAELASSLYKEQPKSNLFHYTSLEGLLGIRDKRALWASKIQYFSDSTELTHAFKLFRRRVDVLHGNDLGPQELLQQLVHWLELTARAANADLFVVSFTERGDSLSQWRGYTPLGKGACIELQPEHLLECTKAQGFDVARCVYKHDEQALVADRAMDLFVAEAARIGPDPNSSPGSSYWPAFTALLQDLLRVAVTFKHWAFEDEKEWRAVLRLDRMRSESRVEYRVGRSTVIPFVLLSLLRPGAVDFRIWNVWVGPSPHSDLSVAALRSLFANQVACGRYPVMASSAPYRETI